MPAESNINFEEEEYIPENPPPRRKPGRPTGSKGKRGFLKLINRNMDKVESMLNDKQKKYLKESFAGLVEYDPLIQAEIFMILYQLYITEVMEKAMNSTDKEGNPSVYVSQDIAQTLGQYRMGLKDVEDMRVRRETQRLKDADNEKHVDPTRKSTSLLAEMIGEDDD